MGLILERFTTKGLRSLVPRKTVPRIESHDNALSVKLFTTARYTGLIVHTWSSRPGPNTGRKGGTVKGQEDYVKGRYRFNSFF